MEPSLLENVTEHLKTLIQHREDFQTTYSSKTAEFLDGLPGLFHLFHRLTFDLDLAPELRRMAASIAIYIAEPNDYCGEFNLGVGGLIDDLWLAYTGLHQLAKAVPVNYLQRHWRSETALLPAIELSKDLSNLEEHIPSRVLVKLKTFIEP
jgi:uncharacterized membrane protein YkvA (DUF1232 family)